MDSTQPIDDETPDVRPNKDGVFTIPKAGVWEFGHIEQARPFTSLIVETYARASAMQAMAPSDMLQGTYTGNIADYQRRLQA